MNRDKRKMNGTGGNLMKDGKHTVLSSSSVEPEADVTGHSLVSAVSSSLTSYPRPFLTCSTRLSTACLVSLRYARRTGT